eukprot:4573220-Prymnesium_polylepis.1
MKLPEFKRKIKDLKIEGIEVDKVCKAVEGHAAKEPVRCMVLDLEVLRVYFRVPGQLLLTVGMAKVKDSSDDDES